MRREVTYLDQVLIVFEWIKYDALLSTTDNVYHDMGIDIKKNDFVFKIKFNKMLTPDCIIKISNYLHDYDIYNFSMSCKNIYKILTSPKYYLNKILIKFGQNYLIDDENVNLKYYCENIKEIKYIALKNNNSFQELFDISYKFNNDDIKVIAMNNHWDIIKLLPAYYNQIKTDLYFMKNMYDDLLNMFLMGYEISQNAWSNFVYGYSIYVNKECFEKIEDYNIYKYIIKLCFSNGMYPSKDIYNMIYPSNIENVLSKLFEECSYHRSVRDPWNYSQNRYVKNYQDTYDYLFNNKNFDGMGPYVFDFYLRRQEYSYFSMTLEEIENVLKTGVIPIHCLFDLVNDFEPTKEYDTNLLKHFVLLKKYNIPIPRCVINKLFKYELKQCYDYFVDNYLSKLIIDEITFERKIHFVYLNSKIK